MSFDYSDVRCPMPGCTGRLYIEWTSTYTLSVGDLTDVDVPSATGAHCQRWDIRCEEGHVVLIPGDTGCGCDDPEGPGCKHDPLAYDWSDENRTLRLNDMARLRALVPFFAAIAEGVRS
ncbi:MAG: hypothetical protein J0I34_07445 [Pseudonocardia sp.]|uniref:hypothetical protein n=1 Tax=Actinomycetes TaxID=1760 RepID=UPI00086FA25A|nr:MULTISPECIES: hypothetical protein [Actinomycetes]MBN9108602.1 hypothetical protein [Pseudonocardia sp.]ODU27481.1 MAG: hypothetical protein ABS80_03630 [Pseudonocardia sp. SCN 72-51]ODV07757.1 MAG: hypothetical protein ABT15_06690 [Pseudonocardia sp. SCN 73-27]